MKSPFVICGATGNVGSKVAGALLAAGEPVRGIARERVRLGPLAARGAEPFPGDIGDAKFLSKAFTGARAVFVMLPTSFNVSDMREYQDRLGESLVSALSDARVPRVVTLSSVGAHLSRGTGPILGLHGLETKIDTLTATAAMHLRPGYFMENHLFSLPVLRERGINGSPIRPDAQIPMVATKDIADVAARLLRDETFTGRAVRYLLGPRDLTMSEATRILGQAIGRPDLKYVQFSEEEARKAMTGMGMSESAVDAMLEMDRGFNEGTIRSTRERNAESTTPTTLEEFAKTVFAHAYRAAA